MNKIELRFMESNIILTLLELLLKEGKNHPVFVDRYTEENIEYVKDLIKKIEGTRHGK